MTFPCKICGAVYQRPEQATECEENNHTKIMQIPVGMRYVVTCRSSECYLKDGAIYGDLAPAEMLAFAHEKRFEYVDKCDPHECEIRDTLKPGGTATGQGGNAGDVSAGGRHA